MSDVRSDESNRGTASPELGFGSAVSREGHLRLINRDGSFNIRRRGLSWRTSLSVYHALLTIGWTRFLALAAASYLVVNAVFALAYLVVGADLGEGTAGGWLERLPSAFFFSVQTSTTIGYGHLRPIGMAANLIVTLESLVGLLGFAIVTGLLFARFSRPTARILFSDRAVVAPYRGITGFQFRIANGRTSQLYDVAAKLTFSWMQLVDGSPVRRFKSLALEIDRIAFFPMAWTIVHPIDDRSPLAGETLASLQASSGEFLLSLSGIDETFQQAVYVRGSYTADEVVFGARFVSLYDEPRPGEPVSVDLAKLSAIEATPSQVVLL